MPSERRSDKTVTISMLWLAMCFVFMIRIALASVTPVLTQEHGISPVQMGYVLSAWSWAYLAFYPFGGPLVDRFGAWAVLGIGSGLWGLATVALPLSSSVEWLFSLRAVFGLATVMTIPVCAATIGRWFKPQERARAVAAVFSGNQVGLAVGATLAALLLARWGWPSVFYWFGGISLLLTVAWLRFYPDKRVGRAAEPPAGIPPAGPSKHHWVELLRHRSTWGIALGQTGYLYSFYFFFTWFPGYLILERKLTVLESGIVGALPFWAGMLGTLGGGWLGDHLIRRGVSATVSRKAIIGAGLAAATVFMLAAAFAAQTWLAVTLLILCMSCLRMTTGSVNSLPIDLGPQPVVGSLTMIQNFLGNFAGVLAPIITGYIVASTGSFVGALVTAGAMTMFGAVCYLFVLGTLPAQAPAETAGAASPAQ